MGIAGDIVIIVVLGLVAGFVCNKLKLPLFLGYIVIGIIVGPHTGGFTVTNPHELDLLAEIGVALLLFSIGLELSLDELKEARLIALLGTPIQIILTIIFGYVIGKLFSYNDAESLVIGAVVSLSSTMIVLKVLEGRQLLGTLSSKVMIGILIVQDLAAVPMMIVLSVINETLEKHDYTLLVFPIIKATIFLIIIIFIGSKLIPRIFHTVVRMNSQELFLLTVTAVGLGVGFLTYKSGLSFAFGAFVAGIVLNRSDYNHRALSDIIPLRDIFALIFFVTIGMLFNPDHFLQNAGLILMLVILVVIGKFIIFALLSRVFGYYNVIPLAVGLCLSQIGEFSFVIATLAMTNKIIEERLFSIIISTTLITMFISPFLSYLVSPLYSLFKNRPGKERIKVDNCNTSELNGHIIIAGGGRVGLNVAGVLRDLGFPFIIIEQNHRAFEEIKQKNYPVIYGDASNTAVQRAVRARQAKLLLSTVPSIVTSKELITTMRVFNPDITIIARAEGLEEMKELAKMNIFELVQPEFEASLEIIRQSLHFLDMPGFAIQQYTDDVRHKQYSPLYFESDALRVRMPKNFRNVSMLLQLYWIELPSKSYAAGKAIRGLRIREKTGASIVGVCRNETFHPNPSSDFVFEENDLVAIIGGAKSRENCLNLLL